MSHDLGVRTSATKKRVLFVDDDQAILDGLEDLFFRDRKRWEMAFALGGVRALAELRARPFDVVVSDMRMPGMDGATFLGIVRAEFPATVRIVLSGFAESESIVRAVASMHQYFSKPCDADRLRAAIDAVDVAGGPTSDTRALIGSLDRVPSPPLVYIELTELARDPSRTIADAAKVFSRDPGLAAKVLQLANSVAFGPRRAIISIADCVAYLGIDMIRCLALTSSVFVVDGRASAAGFSLDDMQALSFRTAALTRKLHGVAKDAELAFVAALLHDIGEAVLAVGASRLYADLRRTATATGESLVSAERRVLGATHAELAACLLGMWGLPSEVVEIVAHHHDPMAARPALHGILGALHAAHAFVGPSAGEPEQLIDLGMLEALGCASQLDGWRAIAVEP